MKRAPEGLSLFKITPPKASSFFAPRGAMCSATKMIDYWLILCQLVPFAQVVLLTAMEFLREEEQEKEEDNVETKDSISEEEVGLDLGRVGLCAL